MKLNRVIAFALVLVMLFALTACGSKTAEKEEAAAPETAAPEEAAPAEEAAPEEAAEEEAPAESAEAETIRIGISCCLMQNEFFAEQIDWYYKICEEKYPNVEIVSVLDANLDSQKDLENIAVFVSQQVDLIIISLSDFNSAQEIINAANGIPIVFTNRQPTDMSVLTEGQHCYVGTNEYEMGYMMGEFLANTLKEQGATEINYLSLLGELTAQNSIQRAEGEVAALEDSGLTLNCQLEDTCNWSRTEALQKTEQVLGAGKPVNCIVTGCDEIALGAIEALKAGNVDLATVGVGGIDGVAAAFESIKAGELDCTVIQPAYEQAATALECAVKILEGTSVDMENNCPPTLVSADNIADY